MITTETPAATISDHGMVLGCMAVLKNAGMTKEQAVPYYAKLLEHHGLTTEAIMSNYISATHHLPDRDLARAHLLEICPELAREI